MKLNNKGFTLVEVLAVVVIIGVVGGIAVVGVLSSINSGKEASYKLMISDIVVACGVLYEEVEFGNNVYKYDTNGSTSNKIGKSGTVININLQTLVSKGYLSGSENKIKGDGANHNKRIIIDPKTKEDIGNCEISIERINGTYFVKNISSDDNCPSEYVKEVK